MRKVKSINGLICLVNSKSILGKIVKHFSRTNINHTYLGYRDNFTLNVTFPTVCVSRYKKKKEEQTTFIKVNKSNKEISMALDRMFDEYVDTKYNWRKVVGYVWVYLQKKAFNRAVGNPFCKEKEAVCYELILFYVRDELKIPGFEKIDTHDSHFIEDMAKIMKDSDFFEEVEYIG